MGRRRRSNFPAIWFNRAAAVTVSDQSIVSTILAPDMEDTTTATDAL